MNASGQARLGVAIVTYNAAGTIGECLDTLFAAEGVDLCVVVADNASTDGTVQVVRDWAGGEGAFERPAASPLTGGLPARRPVACDLREAGDTAVPRLPLTVIPTGINGGFAFAANRAIAMLLADPQVDTVWVLNPDCAVPPETPRKLIEAAARGPFAMIGMRQLFHADPDVIQSDGFRLDRRSGASISLNARRRVTEAVLPDETSLDFVSGASMAVSRRFIESAGPMREDYFLYYEEPDWAMRRGDLPIRLVDAAVYHHGGASIGTGNLRERPSAFAAYLMTRNRVRFVRRFLPGRVGAVRRHVMQRALKSLVQGAPGLAWAMVAGSFELWPPAGVRARLTDPRVQALAFGDPA